MTNTPNSNRHINIAELSSCQRQLKDEQIGPHEWLQIQKRFIIQQKLSAQAQKTILLNKLNKINDLLPTATPSTRPYIRSFRT